LLSKDEARRIAANIANVFRWTLSNTWSIERRYSTCERKAWPMSHTIIAATNGIILITGCPCSQLTKRSATAKITIAATIIFANQ